MISKQDKQDRAGREFLQRQNMETAVLVSRFLEAF